MSLNLRPDYDDEITLPNWIGETSLTLAEIGAVVLLACMQSGNVSDEMGARMGAEETGTALKSLRDKGAVQMALKGDKLSISMDLDALRVSPSNAQGKQPAPSKAQ